MVGICFGMVSCQNGQENITGESTAESEQDAQVETRIEYIYELKYEEVEFLPESAKEAWREPLIKLLANACVMVNDGEDGVNFLPPNPDLPSVAYGVSVGLFDFDLDGVPEVIVNQGGGSSGNAFYTVYDLMTGEVGLSLNSFAFSNCLRILRAGLPSPQKTYSKAPNKGATKTTNIQLNLDEGFLCLLKIYRMQPIVTIAITICATIAISEW